MTSDERSLPSAAPPYEGLDGSGTDLSRLMSLSDGVFAFALTFLVVSLILPAVGNTALPSLPTYLRKLGPGFLAYALSFAVITAWWDAHHRLFSPLVRYDATLVRLNNLFLLVISITPFLVALLVDYEPGGGVPVSSSQLAIAIYAGAQALGGLDLLLIWRHATRDHRLVRPDLPDDWIRGTERQQLAGVGVFLLSVPVAWVSPIGAELVWIAMIFFRFQRHVSRPRPARPREGLGA